MDEKDRPASSASGDETLDAGALRAAFGPAPTSVVATLEKRFGVASRVVLRETADEQGPVVLPRRAGQPALEDRGGRYEVFGELARGGVGVVLKGRDRDLGRDVAIKVLHPEHARRAGMAQRFIEEAQIAGQLQHPGILPVFELGFSEEHQLFFSMKLIKGSTLSALLADRASPGAERQHFLSIFEHVCQTVAYAHAKGVVHRDLKPANVMVGSFGEVQVVDWGLGKVLPRGGTADERTARATRANRADDEGVRTVRSGPEGSRSIAGSVMGTPAYMPPEQARGEVESLDERSDVFSLGAILCEVLTGDAPYRGDDALDQAAQAALDPALGRLGACGADTDLVDLCARCLAPLPGDRPRDAGAVAREVSAYLKSLEDRARASELAAIEAAARASEERRARRLTLGLAAAVLVVLVVTAGAVFRIREERTSQLLERTGLVAGALDRAAALLGEARAAPAGRGREWTEARSAGQHLESLLGVGSVEPRTRARAAAFLTDLDSADRDRRMVERIENLTLLGSTHEDVESWLWMDDQFAAAFRDYGIDVAALGGDEILDRIGQSAIDAELANALDLWVRTSFYVLMQGHPRYTREVLMPRVDLIFEAEPDPLRKRLRRFFYDPRTEDLHEIAATNDLDALPAKTLSLVVSNYARVGFPDGWQEVCRRGFLSHPDDVSLVSTCAFCFAQTGRWGAAARFYTVAVALRPGTGGLWRGLGHALSRLGDREGAVEALRRSVHFQPDYAHTHLDLGVELLASGRPEEAEGAFRDAVRLQPRLAQAVAEARNKKEVPR